MKTNDFFCHCEYEKKLSLNTLKAYKQDLNQFRQYVLEKFKVSDYKKIKKLHLKEYFHYLNKYSSKTMKRKVATLKVYFNYLEYEDKIKENPFRKINLKIRIEKTLPHVLSLTEIELILDKLYKYKYKLTKNSYQYYIAIRNIAVVELLFATGIRVSELCHLKKKNILSDFSSIKILGKGNKERLIPITNASTINALKINYESFKDKIDDEKYFFINRLNNRLSEQSVRLLIKKISSELGFEQEITPHVFRHTFATLLLEANINIRYIQELLGHSSILITQIYTHVCNKKAFEILSLKHPRNKINIS